VGTSRLAPTAPGVSFWSFWPWKEETSSAAGVKGTTPDMMMDEAVEAETDEANNLRAPQERKFEDLDSRKCFWKAEKSFEI